MNDSLLVSREVGTVEMNHYITCLPVTVPPSQFTSNKSLPNDSLLINRLVGDDSLLVNLMVGTVVMN